MGLDARLFRSQGKDNAGEEWGPCPGRGTVYVPPITVWVGGMAVGPVTFPPQLREGGAPGFGDGPIVGVRLRLDLGVEELGEARVVGHVLEIGVGAGLNAVAGVVLDGFGEVFEALVRIAGHAGEEGHAVEGVVCVGCGGEDLAQVVAGVLVLAFVEQGDGVVVLFFGVGEVVLAFGRLHKAGVDVDADAVGELRGRGEQHLVEGGVGLLVLALLHELEGSLVAGEGGGAAGINLLRGSSGEDAGTALRGCRRSRYGFGMCHRSSPEAVRSRNPLAVEHGRLRVTGLPSYTQRGARGQEAGVGERRQGRGKRGEKTGKREEGREYWGEGCQGVLEEWR